MDLYTFVFTGSKIIKEKAIAATGGNFELGIFLSEF